MSVSFPPISTTVAAVNIPEVPAVPAVHAGNVRFSDKHKCTFLPTWSGANLSGVAGEWFWEVGSWSQDGTTWTSANTYKNHYEPNLLDPAFVTAYPEVAVMAQAFAAMASISAKKGVI